MYAKRIPGWSNLGYRTTLHFLELPSADYAVQRVALRAAAGGHSFPEADVRRRFRRGLSLFHRDFKHLVDKWYHWFGDDGGLRLVEHNER